METAVSLDNRLVSAINRLRGGHGSVGDKN